MRGRELGLAASASSACHAASRDGIYRGTIVLKGDDANATATPTIAMRTEAQDRVQLRALRAERAELLAHMTSQVGDLQTATALGQWPADELRAPLD